MNHVSLQRAAGAEVEPVSIEELAAFCRITDAADEAQLKVLGIAARQRVEDLTGRALTEQSWVLQAPDWHHLYDCRDARTIYFDRTPLVSIDSVQYFDAVTETLTTWDAANYHVLTGFEPGRLVRDADSSWPDVDDRPDAVQITFTAGYDDPDDVPQHYAHAVRFLTRHFWDYRDVMVDGRMEEMPQGFDALISGMRVGGYVG